MHTTLAANSISFSYDTALAPLFSDVSFTLGSGWSGVVGPNGAGKTTLVKLLSGLLVPDAGNVSGPESRIICPQETSVRSDELFELQADPDERAYRIIDAFGVAYDWPYRWDTLSYGERRRAQVAALLYANPSMLVLDEPTNHLDRNAVRAVTRGLELYDGIGIIISHDRTLLDAICVRTLFVEAGGVTLRPGSVSSGMAEAERERESALRERAKARADVAHLRQEASSRRALAASQQARRSKKGLALKDHDARFKRNLARISGKDGTGGKLLRQLDGRLKQAEEKLSSINVGAVRKSGVTIRGDASRSDFLFRFGPARLPLGEERRLEAGELALTANDRVIVSGANGCGKTTLLRAIIAGPLGGTERPGSRFAFMPQELEAADVQKLLGRLSSLSLDERGAILSTVSRLGSDPERFIGAQTLSPGEARKLLLAFAIEDNVSLIVMDEPTNHMDLPSIVAVTAALREFAGALLVVTHDEHFAADIGKTFWEIEDDAGRSGNLIVTVEQKGEL